MIYQIKSKILNSDWLPCSEADIQSELWLALRERGFNVRLEYKDVDIIFINGETIVYGLELKRAEKLTPTNQKRLEKQMDKHRKKINAPIAGILGLAGARKFIRRIDRCGPPWDEHKMPRKPRPAKQCSQEEMRQAVARLYVPTLPVINETRPRRPAIIAAAN